MSSERLVFLRSYANPVEAERDMEVLRESGLEPSVLGQNERFEWVDVIVPESQLEVARAALNIEPASADEPAPEEFEVKPTLSSACPNCHASDTERIPPYALWALVASVLLLGVTATLGQASGSAGSSSDGWPRPG